MEKLRNRLFAGGTAAFLLMNALPMQTAYTAFAAEIEAASRGDVNGDGKRNSDDLDALTKLLSEHVETIFAEKQYVQYDITEDGLIDARDRYALSQYLSGAAADLPTKPGKDLEESVTMALNNATCFPGDDFQVVLSFVNWTKDIAAYDITVGFDSALKLKKTECVSESTVTAAGSRSVKLSGLYDLDALHRGDIAVLTFTAPADFTELSEFSIQVEGSNIFSSEYGVYPTVKPTATVTVQPLYEPVSLQASGIGSNSVSIKWDMPFAEQPVTGYRVYRGGEKIGETTETCYTDTKLTADTDYEYTVSAVTASGTETAQSLALNVHTSAVQIVSADFPAETVSDANSDLTVKLSQTAPLSELQLDITGPDKKTTTLKSDLSGEDLNLITYHWDVSKLADGAYQIQVTVRDTDGNEANAETSVNVLNHPLEPLTLSAKEGGRTAVLSWKMATEAAVTGYRVYRLNKDGKSWDQIAEIDARSTLTYTDSGLTAGQKYTYSVTSVDSYGQESEKSNSVSVTPAADKNAPEITRFTPASGKRLSGDIQISIEARDENSVQSVRCEISSDSGKTWKTICEAEGDSAEWTLHTTDYEDGVYQLRAMAVDADQNESSGINVISIAFDNTAPEQVKNVHIVSVSPTSGTLGWDDVADEDFDHFVVIISDKSGTREQTVQKELGINLNLVPNTDYTVSVYAVDQAGNAGPASEPFRFVSTSDVTPPLISTVGISSDYAAAGVPLTVSVTASDTAGVYARFLEYSQDQKTWSRLTLYDAGRNFIINDPKLKEGTLYLRAYASDRYGNTGDPNQAKVYEVPVDNTAPLSAKSLKVEKALRANVLSWTASSSDDVKSYAVERSVDNDQNYVLVAPKISGTTFTDSNVEADGIYFYRLYAVDRAGNRSEAIESGEVHRTPDTEPPTIVECGLTSGDQIVCSAHRMLQVLATDNSRIQKIEAAYRCKDTDKWTALKTTETTHNSAYTEMIVSTELPEAILKESSVTVQITATDAAGTPAVKEYTFTVDDRKAEILNAAAKTEAKAVNVSWSCPDVTGVSSFYVWRKNGTAGKEICIAQVKPEKDKTDYSYADTDLETGGTIIYRILARMTNGNQVSVTLDPIKIQAVPKAVLEYTSAQVLGASYSYDARGSRNADDITKVEITFGDGGHSEKTSVQNANFTYTYKEAGTYTVTLKVTNASGMSDTFTGTVTVAEPDIMATVHATVLKMDGTAAAGATVYVDVGTEYQTKYTTNASGQVDITCTAGEHEFGVFGNGYLPATRSCSLQPGSKTDLEFNIVEDQLVKADFSVHRMSLSEIKAEGINVKDPENCQLVKIDVELSYTITTTVTDHIKIYYDRTNGIVVGTGRGGGGGGSGSDSGYDYIVKTVTHDVKTVVLMRVPVKAQFIKEFFKVDMIVMNNADAEFPLTDCTAALNVPSGLTIVEDAPSSSPRVANIGTIGGGSQQTVSWIVRGDKNGSYSFNADFNATLQPFGEPVSLNFQSNQPIKVYGQEAAAITVTFDPVVKNKTLYAEVLVENKSPIDLNELETGIGQVIADTVGNDKDGNPRAMIYQTRFTDTDGILRIVNPSEKISVLHPGQKFSVVYAIRGITASKLPGTYSDTAAQIKYTSTSNNVKVQVQHIKIADVNDPFYGIAFDPDKDFLFMVTNKNGQSIDGANITLTKDGATVASGTADDRGRLVVPRGDANTTYHVVITAEGYTDYDETFEFPKRKTTHLETFVMSGDYDDSDFSLTYANYREAGAGSVNLLTRSVTIDRYGDITFSIVATARNAGAKYELVQGRRVIRSQDAQGKTMAFMDLTPNLFYADEPVCIRITAKEGDEFETRLGLNIIQIPRNPEDDPKVQSIRDKIIDTFSDEFTVSIPAPLEMENSFGDYLDLTVAIPNFKDEKNPTTPFSVNMAIDGDKLTLKLTFSVSKEFEIGPVGVEFGLEVEAAGEVDFEKNTAEVGVTVTGSLSGSVSTPEFRPPVLPAVFAKFTFSASGSYNVNVTYTHDFSNEPKNELSISLGAGFTIGVTIAAGVGSEELLAAEVYGEPSFTVESRIVPNPDLTKVEFAIDAGFKIIFMDNELETIKIYSGTLTFYPRSEGRPRVFLPNGQPLDAVVKDTNQFTTISTENMPVAGAWNGQLGSGITEMQQGVSLSSAPKLITCGDSTIMVWTLQDASRGANNASYLVYSVYDSASKTWSEPAAVDDNNQADTAPMLFAGSDGIRLAYLESTKVYEADETVSLTDFAMLHQFKTAKFDAESGKFTDFRSMDVNAEGGFASTPVFTQAADGTTYLVWKSNANGQIFGNDNSNQIFCAKETEDGWDTPTVLAEQLPEIVGLTCGTNADGEPVYAYVTSTEDEEGALLDKLYVADFAGNVTELASGSIGAPKFSAIPGKDASGLIWYQNNKLCASTDLATAEDLCSEEYGLTERYAVAGDRILFLRNDKNCANVYSMRYDSETGKMTAPVVIETGDKIYYESLSVAQSGADTLYAMRRTEAELTASDVISSSALTGGILTETNDIRISEPEFNYPDAAAGKELPLSLNVANDGTDTVESLTLHIQDAAGNEIASDTQTVALKSGASEAVQFKPVLPAELKAAVYNVFVTSSDSDRTPENNQTTLDLSKTDLALETDVTYIGNKTRVTIFAVNNSNLPSAAVVHIQPASAEEETLTLFSEEIAPHSSAYWQLDSADMLGDIYRDFVHITLESTVSDADESNNMESVIISKSGLDPYAAGDVNLDGTVELEDAMLALMCYTSRVAKRENLGFSATQQRCADIDKDGIVDVTDAMSILTYYVNSIAGNVKVSFAEYLAQKQNGGDEHESE